MYEIIPGKKQNHWRWPVALNFFMGGTGAGLYILVFFFTRDLTYQEGIISVHFLKLISPALVAAGLLSVATETGRPLRGWRLFANIRQSWMSREVLFAAAFIFLSLADGIIDSIILTFFSAISAFLFVISQAMILYRSFAVPAWNQRALPLFFVSSSLLNGFGLFLFLCMVNLYHVNSFYLLNTKLLIYGMVCICLTLAIWMAYISRIEGTSQDIFYPRSNRVLVKEAGIGGLLPLLGLAAIAFKGNWSAAESMAIVLYAICGSAILALGYYRLHKMVSGINYLKPVLLNHSSTRIKYPVPNRSRKG